MNAPNRPAFEPVVRQGGQRSTPPRRGPGPDGSPARRSVRPGQRDTNWVPTYQRPALA